MVLTVASCSSRRSGFLVTVIRGIVFRELDAGVEASEPHDLTVRGRLRQRLRRAWYPSAEALAKAGSALFVKSAAASTASRTYVCDDRETPLCVGRDGGSYGVDLPDEQNEIFLQRGLDSQFTGKSLICPSGRSVDPLKQILSYAQPE